MGISKYTLHTKWPAKFRSLVQQVGIFLKYVFYWSHLCNKILDPNYPCRKKKRFAFLYW